MNTNLWVFVFWSCATNSWDSEQRVPEHSKKVSHEYDWKGVDDLDKEGKALWNHCWVSHDCKTEKVHCKEIQKAIKKSSFKSPGSATEVL